MWAFYCYPHFLPQLPYKKMKQVSETMCLDKERLLNIKVGGGGIFLKDTIQGNAKVILDMLWNYVHTIITLLRQKQIAFDSGIYTKTTLNRSRRQMRKGQNHTAQSYPFLVQLRTNLHQHLASFTQRVLCFFAQNR